MKLTFFSVSASLLFACDQGNILIQRETVLEDVATIKKTLSDEDSLKIEYLDKLSDYSLGFDKLVEKEDLKEDYIKEYASINAYKISMDSLFSEAKRKQYTYRDLLYEIDTVIKVKKSFDLEYKNIFKRIDISCKEIQNKIDSLNIEQNRMNDSLKKYLLIELLNIKNSEYANGVEVKFSIKNNLKKPIYAVVFQAILTDRLGEVVEYLDLKSNETINSKLLGTWHFDRFGENSNIYRSLENVEARHVKVDYKIKKINIGGKIFDFESPILVNSDFVDYRKTKKYDPSKHYGYCVYFKTDHPLEIELKKLNERVERLYSEKKLPILRLIGNLTIYDF